MSSRYTPCLMCIEEMSIFQQQPDYLSIINTKGLPIGVLQVKKPGKALNSKKVLRQLYSHMLRLQSFHGLHHVFGIVSTYAEWQIFWLEGTNDAAASQTSHSTTELQSPLPLLEAGDRDEEEEVNEATSTDLPEGVMHGSEPIRYDDPSFSKVMLTVLMKMYNSPVSSVQELSADRPYIVVNPWSWKWKKVQWKTNKLNRYLL